MPLKTQDVEGVSMFQRNYRKFSEGFRGITFSGVSESFKGVTGLFRGFHEIMRGF